MLWSHSRDIHVRVFQNKVIYSIPLYNDLVFNNFKAEYKFGSIIMTTFQEPIQYHLVKPSYDNQKVEMEQLAETDKYSLSHQLAYREMK